MKSGIHPTWNSVVDVVCICGNAFTIATTVAGPIKVEVCPQCHPVYNKGIIQKKIAKGRLESFLEKQKRIDSLQK